VAELQIKEYREGRKEDGKAGGEEDRPAAGASGGDFRGAVELLGRRRDLYENRLGWPLAEYWRVISPWNFDDNWFRTALGGEVLVHPLAEHRGMNSDGVIGGGIVIRGAAKDAPADLLLVDLVDIVVENPVTDVDEHLPQAS
jgi:hypothetical protein